MSLRTTGEIVFVVGAILFGLGEVAGGVSPGHNTQYAILYIVGGAILLTSGAVLFILGRSK